MQMRINRIANFQQRRTARGNLLVEVLISSLMAAVLMAGVTRMLVDVKKTGNATQGQLVASAVVQEVMDQVHVLPYDLIAANQGFHKPVVNGAAPTGDALFPRPLLQDFGSLDYSVNDDPLVMSEQKQRDLNLFRTFDPITHERTDSLDVDIVPGANADTLVVTATICWFDTNAFRTYSASTTLTKSGLNG
jgi:hypothetical protein